MKIFSLKCCFAILILIQCSLTFAQKSLLHWGIAAQAAAKHDFFDNEGQPYLLFGKANMNLCVYMQDRDEMSISFGGKIGINLDLTQYVVFKGSVLGLENYSIVLNPEMLIPTRYPKLKVAAGFALDWKILSGMYESSTEDNTKWTGFDPGQAERIIEEYQRKVIPLITLGILYQIQADIWLQAIVQQSMLNSLPRDPVVSLWNNGGRKDVRLHHQPTYFGLCLWYYFN
jgi:hypothetical protein